MILLPVASFLITTGTANTTGRDRNRAVDALSRGLSAEVLRCCWIKRCVLIGSYLETADGVVSVLR